MRIAPPGMKCHDLVNEIQKLK